MKLTNFLGFFAVPAAYAWTVTLRSSTDTIADFPISGEEDECDYISTSNNAYYNRVAVSGLQGWQTAQFFRNGHDCGNNTAPATLTLTRNGRYRNWSWVDHEWFRVG